MELTSAAPPCSWAKRKHRDVSRCRDRKSTRLNSSHGYISDAGFCLKKEQVDLPTVGIDAASDDLSGRPGIVVRPEDAHALAEVEPVLALRHALTAHRPILSTRKRGY